MGNNECKLNKAQKRMLKDKEIYNHFNLENIIIDKNTFCIIGIQNVKSGY